MCVCLTCLAVDASEIKASSIEWLREYHAAGDALNPDVSVPKFYTPDCVMRFPGQPPLQGHDAIKGFFTKQFSLLDRMTHTIGHVDVVSDRIYQEAKIEYVVKGDPEQKVIKIDGYLNLRTVRPATTERLAGAVWHHDAILDPEDISGQKTSVWYWVAKDSI
ncbi:unnamed protein product [Penicillium glandicola]